MNDDLPMLGDLLGYDPWEEVDRRLDIEMALNRIHPLYREALILWGQGYPYLQIAKKLQIGKTTARRYVLAGKARLRELLDQD